MAPPTHDAAHDAADVAVTHDDGVATLWLDRPAKHNAVTYEMWQTIADRCAELADDPSVRVLVVRGRGDHFCAGADIGGLDAVDGERYSAANRAADDGLASFPKPTIACISGSCIGGGAELAIACDLRIADRTARFGITPARLGIVYPPFALERAVRVIGASASKHLLFTAEIVDADRALRIGLVDEVHEDAAATTARVAQLARTMAGDRSLLTQVASKEMVDEVVLDGTVDPATAARWAATVAASGDRAEGIAAFLERRPPVFGWRPPSKD